jgi:peptidyl-prolyl cis-trans isomerase A (cyclophilin A)
MRIFLFFTLTLSILFLACCQTRNPRVVMHTDLGDIMVELYLEKAPVTARNFLRYVDEGRFHDASFYRVVHLSNQPRDSIRIEVIQGGLMDHHEDQMLPPIAHEGTDQTGILHLDGTISMARWKPGTATSEFFICIGSQPQLDFGGKRNPDGQGFAAFGRVVDGMDVVRKIQRLPDRDQMLETPVRIEFMERK